MGWKSTVIISRQEAIELILKRGDMWYLTNEELGDMLDDLYGDDTELEYYGHNFIINDNVK